MIMAKNLKLDESGDSEDLQALFDDIAISATQKPKLEVVAEPPALGDNPDLESLFDSIAAESVPEVGTVSPSLQPAENDADGHSGDTVFNKVGTMTRQLHDCLRGLGVEDAVQHAAEQIPDTRERLAYITRMTEQAASRVLNATDVVRPVISKFDTDRAGLDARWDAMFANQLSVEEFKALAADTRSFLKGGVEVGKTMNEQITEIVMAQDFQDLTGQVIKKVVDLVQQLESQLLQVLIESMPEEKRVEAGDGLLNGPVINSVGRNDVVTSQEQVDELLESLGF